MRYISRKSKCWVLFRTDSFLAYGIDAIEHRRECPSKLESTYGHNSQRIRGLPFSMATGGLIICTCHYSNVVYSIPFVVSVLWVEWSYQIVTIKLYECLNFNIFAPILSTSHRYQLIHAQKTSSMDPPDIIPERTGQNGVLSGELNSTRIGVEVGENSKFDFRKEKKKTPLKSRRFSYHHGRVFKRIRCVLGVLNFEEVGEVNESWTKSGSVQSSVLSVELRSASTQKVKIYTTSVCHIGHPRFRSMR